MDHKNVPIVRSAKLLNAARGRSCSHCGKQDGTIVRCHYTGFRQITLGKGWAKKVSDLAAADLCHECHEVFDNLEAGQGETDQERALDQSEQFLYAILVTIHRDFIEGVLQVGDGNASFFTTF